MGYAFKAALAALLLAVGAVGAQAAQPAASDWADSEAGRLRLVSATTGTGDESAVRLGLHFDLKPGWKIYWRTPGDAGYPPKIDWSGSTNVGEATISWPAPKRFVLAGLQNHGYAGEVILPLDMAIPDPGRPVHLKAKVDYLACAEICVPMDSALVLDLPAGPAEPSAFAHDISRFDALVPGDGARHGLTLDAVEAVGAEAIRVTLSSAIPFDHPDLFVEPPELAAFDQPRVEMLDGGRRAVIEAPVIAGTLNGDLTASPVTITVVDGARSLEATRTAIPGAATAPADGLAWMLAVALLGGLILNLMPCVLPVLSIKVVGAIGHGGAQRGHVRGAFLASAAGIVASFLVLAGAAIAVKAAGAAVGWGIQFQQPAFLAVMVAILALFAANLWGLFEVPLPAFLSQGGNGKAHHTLFGHFLSGAFATLLATPCSAPFLGTAVGFALARGPIEIAAIFAALGLGMAAPYLAVAIWPGIAQRLPRPGRWMVGLKMALGLALAGTALWLLTVLAAQTGAATAALTGGAMASAVVMLAARRRLPAQSRLAASVAVAALAAFAVAAPLQADFATDQEWSGDTAIAWEKFDQAALAGHLAAGRVVFVDVTADWCITCKVNKAAVIERGEVARILAEGKAVAMKADWTKPDDGIARYLASFGRYGIPFNAVYGPAAPQGIALPELLTESEVLDALDRAAGGTLAVR